MILFKCDRLRWGATGSVIIVQHRFHVSMRGACITFMSFHGPTSPGWPSAPHSSCELPASGCCGLPAGGITVSQPENCDTAHGRATALCAFRAGCLEAHSCTSSRSACCSTIVSYGRIRVGGHFYFAILRNHRVSIPVKPSNGFCVIFLQWEKMEKCKDAH